MMRVVGAIKSLRSFQISRFCNSAFPGFHCCQQIDESHPCFKQLWEHIVNVRSLQSVPSAVEQWRATTGNQLSQQLMTTILLKLCSRNWFYDADKLVNWLDEQQAFQLTDSDKLLRLDILCHLRTRTGIRRQFDTIENKTETAYFIILKAYCGSLMCNAAERIMDELKASKLMSSGQAYSVMLKMYCRLGLVEKAVNTIIEHDASGLPLDAHLYWVMLKHKDNLLRSIPVLEKIQEMIQKVNHNARNKRELLKIHAALANPDAVDNLWNSMKSSQGLVQIDYLAALEAYGMLGKLEEAETISMELELKFAGNAGPSRGHYVSLLRMYSSSGLMEKAEDLVKRMVQQQCQVDYLVCDILVEGYMRLGKLDEAVACFIRIVSDPETLKQSRKVILDCKAKLLRDAFVASGDIHGAEKLMGATLGFRSIEVYKSLIKVYHSAKVPGDARALEHRIKADGLIMDDETRFLLKELAALRGLRMFA